MMLSTIRFWTVSHSSKSLLHDRNFTYYYSDIINNIEKFAFSPNVADIRVIPKYNNNQVEMSFIISHKQLLKLKQIDFNIEKNVLFCFLPLIEFKEYSKPDSTIKLEFWRIVDWEYIYFPATEKNLVGIQNGSITIYARKDIIYSQYKELAPIELFINRSTDFIPSNENLQICSPICAYGADTKTQISKKIIKTHEEQKKEYESIFVINTADITQANKYFSNFSSFWSNWVRDIMTFAPYGFGSYNDMVRFYPSFRGYEKFGDTVWYAKDPNSEKEKFFYPIVSSGANYFPFGSLGSSDTLIYYVPYNKRYIEVETYGGLAGWIWNEEVICTYPYDYKRADVSGYYNTTKIVRNNETIDSYKFYFTYEMGPYYDEIRYAFWHALADYVNFNDFFEKQFLKTAQSIATAMNINFQQVQIEKAKSKTTSTTIKILIPTLMHRSRGRISKHEWYHFLSVKLYSRIVYESALKINYLFQKESPFLDHWDAAHIHKTLVGNRIGVFPLDRRYDYQQAISSEGGNSIIIYNTDSAEIRDTGSINITELETKASDSILLNIEKERDRFNKIQALTNQQNMIRNILNTTSTILDIPTILKPNQDYWNPAPIKVDIPEDSIWEKTGWISEGMKRTGPRIPTLTKTITSHARTEYLQAASQGLPFAFGGSFAAMGIRSVFRGAFATAQGWINSSMERQKAQLQMNLKEQQALNLSINISANLRQQFPWLNRDDIYLLKYTTGNKKLILKDRKKYGNFINDYKFFYELGASKNAYYSVNLENTDWAQLYNLPSTELEIFKALMKNGIFFNPENLNKFATDELPQYAEKWGNNE